MITQNHPFGRPLQTSPQLDALKDSLADVEQAPVLDELAEYVTNAYRVARDHRRSLGIDAEISDARMAVALKYTPEELAKFGDGATVYMGLTNLKVRAAKSWFSDILANAEDQPWTLRPTPDPELPATAEDVVMDRLEQHVAERGFDVELPQRAAEMKTLAAKYVNKVATKATDRLEVVLRDQLLEGGWREAFDEFGKDLMMYPAAVLKGPYLVREPSFRWQGDELKVVNRMKRRVERVDPVDCYPAPNATCPQTGGYFIHRVKATESELLDFATIPGFNETALRAVIAENPRGVRDDVFGSSERDSLDGTDGDAPAPDLRYEIQAYYGRVPAELLQLYGLAQDMDPQKSCEAEVWVCAGWVLRAIMNPHPLGRRPFYATSFERVPGSFWGQSLPLLLRDIQRIANASARSLVRNMSYASGPIGEYDADRLESEEDVSEVQPYRMYAVSGATQAGNTASPAFRFHTVPSVAANLMEVYEWASKKADDLSGIPAYVVGNPQVAGAGRTLGGLSMLMGNAAKGIKAVIGNVDRYVVEPLIRAAYELEMMFGEDKSLKLDVAVIARGSSGILQRELSQARSVEVMQVLVPFATGEKPIVKPDALKIVLRDMLRSLGYSADELVDDPDDEAQLRQALIEMGLPATPEGAPGAVGVNVGDLPTTPLPPPSALATPEPKLDRRSATPPSPDELERLAA